MEEFPDNFYKSYYKIDRKKTLKEYREKIYNIISNNKEKLKKVLAIEFDEYVTSDISSKLVAELRERGFKVSCNYDIYRGKQLLYVG